MNTNIDTGTIQSERSEAVMKRILDAIVVFFHLKFRIPERGMTMLVAFIHGLISTLALFAPQTASIQWLIMKERFPSSLYTS